MRFEASTERLMVKDCASMNSHKCYMDFVENSNVQDAFLDRYRHFISFNSVERRTTTKLIILTLYCETILIFILNGFYECFY